MVSGLAYDVATGLIGTVVPPAAMAPDWFTATELPHDPGSWAGPDHEAASAGWTPQAPSPSSDARAPVLIHLSERAHDCASCMMPSLTHDIARRVRPWPGRRRGPDAYR